MILGVVRYLIWVTLARRNIAEYNQNAKVGPGDKLVTLLGLCDAVVLGKPLIE